MCIYIHIYVYICKRPCTDIVGPVFPASVSVNSYAPCLADSKGLVLLVSPEWFSPLALIIFLPPLM